MEQPEEAAPEPEAEGSRGLRLVGEAGIVQTEFLEGVAKVVELVTVDRIEAGEHHRLRFPIPLEGHVRTVPAGGDRLSRPGLADVLDSSEQVADLARTQLRYRREAGTSHPDLVEGMDSTGLHEAE